MAQLKERISSIIDGGIDKSEVSQIKDLQKEFACLTPEARKEVVDMLNEAFAGASEEAKMAISELKTSICETGETYQYSLEGMTTRPELTHMKASFLSYFEQQASTELSLLSLKEKESVKILLWGEFLKFFSYSLVGSDYMNSLVGKVQGAIQELTNIQMNNLEGDIGMEHIDKVLSEFQFTGDNEGATPGDTNKYSQGILANLKKIQTYKREHPLEDLSDLAHLQAILTGKEVTQSSQEIYSSLEQQSLAIANSLAGKQQLGQQLAGTIENLPLDMGGSVKNYIKELVEKWPFLGILVGFIMGPDFLGEFLSEEESKRRKSIENLFTLSKDINSPVSGVFPEDFGKDFDYKSTQSFFEYLEEQEIDYTTETFWNEVLSGSSRNEKIKNISSLLTGEYGKAIFEQKDTENAGAGFVEKLNSIEQLANREITAMEQERIQAAASALPSIAITSAATPEELPQTTTPSTLLSPEENVEITLPAGENAAQVSGSPIPTEEVTPTNSISPTEITPEVKAQFLTFRDSVIESSLKNAFQFPIHLSYQGKESELSTLGILTPKTIGFTNGILSLDGKEFTTKFSEFTVQGFTIKNLQLLGTPRLSSRSMTLECQTENLGILAGVQNRSVTVEKSKLLEVVHALLTSGKYTGNIPAQNDTPEITFEIS